MTVISHFSDLITYSYFPVIIFTRGTVPNFNSIPFSPTTLPYPSTTTLLFRSPLSPFFLPSFLSITILPSFPSTTILPSFPSITILPSSPSTSTLPILMNQIFKDWKNLKNHSKLSKKIIIYNVLNVDMACLSVRVSVCLCIRLSVCVSVCLPVVFQLAATDERRVKENTICVWMRPDQTRPD